MPDDQDDEEERIPEPLDARRAGFESCLTWMIVIFFLGMFGLAMFFPRCGL